MEEIFGKNAVILLGAMFAALVAGFFAFMNLIASKENKVSEFRQEWINSLRDSVSCYISSLTYLSTVYKHYFEIPEPKKNKLEMARDVEDIYAKVNESFNDIVFRINEDEKNKKGNEINTKFLATLYKTRDHYNKSELSEAREACDPLREATKPLLKYEWKRVKSGELNYKLSKYFSVLVLVVGLVSASLNAYMIWDINGIEKPKVEAKQEPNKSLQPTPKSGAAEL